MKRIPEFSPARLSKFASLLLGLTDLFLSPAEEARRYNVLFMVSKALNLA